MNGFSADVLSGGSWDTWLTRFYIYTSGSLERPEESDLFDPLLPDSYSPCSYSVCLGMGCY